MTAGGHIALLGDSIFDNAAYVPGHPVVIDQLRRALPAGWSASLLAVDGASARDVPSQLEGLQPETTHVFVSAGGSDALNESTLLEQPVLSVAEGQSVIGEAQQRFRRGYSDVMEQVLAMRRSVATSHDFAPGL